jgi:two-component system alkaline phosphatase synthesis response regulator PhoP
MRSLTFVLKRAGYDVLEAHDGKEAVEVLHREVPDLVFLDVMMPLMNGYDVCKNVMQNPELGHVKIVLLTAKGQEADRERGLSSGATEYMTKPFDPDDLLDYAKRVLGLED